jgi:hypothetical protein
VEFVFQLQEALKRAEKNTKLKQDKVTFPQQYTFLSFQVFVISFEVKTLEDKPSHLNSSNVLQVLEIKKLNTETGIVRAEVSKVCHTLPYHMHF